MCQWDLGGRSILYRTEEGLQGRGAACTGRVVGGRYSATVKVRKVGSASMRVFAKSVYLSFQDD